MLDHNVTDKGPVWHFWQIHEMLLIKPNHLKVVELHLKPRSGSTSYSSDKRCCCGEVQGRPNKRNSPGRLDQSLVLLTFQELKVHYDNLESHRNYALREHNVNSPLWLLLLSNENEVPSHRTNRSVLFNSPCADAWRAHRSPAPSGLAAPLWWLGFWYLCSSDQVSMDLESYFMKNFRIKQWFPFHNKCMKAKVPCWILALFPPLPTNYKQQVTLFACLTVCWGPCGLLWFQWKLGGERGFSLTWSSHTIASTERST